LKVKFDHIAENVTDNLTGNKRAFTVVKLARVTAHVRPYPTFAGARALSDMTALRPIEGTSPLVYQQAMLELKGYLSDAPGAAIVLDGASPKTNGKLPTYKIFRTRSGSELSQDKATINIINGVRTIVTRKELPASGDVYIGGDFAGVAVTDLDRAKLSINNVLLQIKALESLGKIGGGTLRGVAKTDAASAQFMMRAIMKDGTKWDSLFYQKTGGSSCIECVPDEAPGICCALPGAISVSVLPENYADVVGKTGTFFLISNYHKQVTATAVYTIDSNVKVQESFACNADPSVGDVDLGSPTGIAVPAVSLGSTFNVELRVNTGSKYLGPFTFELQYDSSVMEVVAVEQGSDLVRAAGGAASKRSNHR
jgi:hypothetical protein